MQKSAQSRLRQFADKLSTYYRLVVNWAGGRFLLCHCQQWKSRPESNIFGFCAENPKLSERRRMVQLYKGKLCKGQDVGERVASYTYGTGPIV